MKNKDCRAKTLRGVDACVCLCLLLCGFVYVCINLHVCMRNVFMYMSWVCVTVKGISFNSCC